MLRIDPGGRQFSARVWSMSDWAVGAIAELLAAVGALAALIYLVLQLKHRTEALRKSELAPGPQQASRGHTPGQKQWGQEQRNNGVGINGVGDRPKCLRLLLERKI